MADFGTIKKTVDRAPEIEAAIRELASKRVMVGVPAQNAFRPPDPGETEAPPNNAALLYIHEHGAPEAHIPARPSLIPGIESAKDKISRGLEKAGKLALEGKREETMNALMAVGSTAESAVKKKMRDGPFTPLSIRTIQARANRNTTTGRAGSRKGAKLYLKAKKAGTAIDPSWVKPLIDTSKLWASITYVIRTVRSTD